MEYFNINAFILGSLLFACLYAYSDESEPLIRQSEPLKSGGFLGG